MKLLFQITTGNPLPLMITDIQNTADLAWTITPFTFFFFVVSNFIFLNVFIALLLENFEYNLEGEFAIEEVDAEQFGVAWKKSPFIKNGLLQVRPQPPLPCPALPTRSAAHLAPAYRRASRPQTIRHDHSTTSTRPQALDRKHACMIIAEECLGLVWCPVVQIANLENFMFELQGPLSVVVETDPFWHNRLLLELDSNAEDELENTKSFAVEEIMLALCRMRFGNSCAPHHQDHDSCAIDAWC